MRPAGSQIELERRRVVAVTRVLEGYSQEEVADLLGVSKGSVSKWMSAYDLHSWDGLKAAPIAGRPHKLSRTQEKIITRWLQESPQGLGFATDLWTGDRLASLVKGEFGIHFNSHYFDAWLRDHGFTPQYPKYVPRERDPRRIAYWARITWPRIQKMAVKTGRIIAFIDESGVLMAPLRRRTWSPRGQRPTLGYKGKGQRDKVSVAAAILMEPKRRRFELYFQTLVNEYFTNFEDACFIEALIRKINKPMIVIWDRGNMHRGDHIVALKKAYSGSIRIEKLPPYAPMMNPVETLWSWLKYDRLCNFAAADVKELNERATAELQRAASQPELLEAFVRMSELPYPVSLLS